MIRSCRLVVMAVALVSVITGCRRGGERIIEIRQPTAYLTCEPPATWPAPVSQEVGSAGATLQSGNNRLVIPPNALPGSSTRTFTLGPIQSDTVGVEVTMSAQGRLRRTATLEIDMRCGSADDDWFIWRIRPGSQSQKLPTNFAQGRATAQIDTTSGFMIAN